MTQQIHAAKAEGEKAPPEPSVNVSISVTKRELAIVNGVRQRYNIDRSAAWRLITNEYDRLAKAEQANK